MKDQKERAAAIQLESRSQVLIDGVDIRALQLKWLRKQMGIVNQARPSSFASRML